MNRPNYIDPQHWLEWRCSGVAPEIISLNVRSLSGNTPYDYLLWSDRISRRNDGRLRDGDLRKYNHLFDGGWWCSGIDPLESTSTVDNTSHTGEGAYLPPVAEAAMLWGCFKPNHPRSSANNQGFGQTNSGKLIKYEHPYKEPTRAFFLAVGVLTWLKVAQRYNIPITDEDIKHGFWHWVWLRNVPIILCEGAKKAGCLLTQGYAAIALPGINGAYRNPKEEYSEPTLPFLIPDIAHFAKPGREIFICFDADAKPKTIQMVNAAITATIKLLEAAGCKNRVIVIPPTTQKVGVDDFIVAVGAEEFEHLYQQAVSFEQWLLQQYSRLTLVPDLIVNRRYLGNLPLPRDAKLIAIHSPKGTGKTESLIRIVTEAIRSGQPVILLTHRVQLGQALAERLGIPYVTEVRGSETGALLGFALCVDSLHSKSQARFNAEHWQEPLVILDECEQIIWHTLNASTQVKAHRVEVIRSLGVLLYNALTSERGRVILCDADLSDLSIEFVLGLAQVQVSPFIIVNQWKPEQGCSVYHYGQTKPLVWYEALLQHIRSGGKPFIITHSQKAKSKWSTQNLEAILKQQFKDASILRIDSETIANPNHPAYGCISKLNEILVHYDIVIVSPSIETGVSVDIQGHFTSVWGCLMGICPENTARQSLARVREGVARHLWVASRGLEFVGNGAKSVKSMLASEKFKLKAHLQLLKDAAFSVSADDNINVNQTALQVWAKMACRVNAGMHSYRHSVLLGLLLEGHYLMEPSNTLSQEDIAQLDKTLKSSQQKNYGAFCSAIAEVDISEMTPQKYEALCNQKSKTDTERYSQRKYHLVERYGVTVTLNLVAQDEDGWYPQLRLLYYLTVGRKYLSQRDSRIAEAMLKEGSNQLWLPDFNRSQLGAAVAVLEKLGIPQLCDSEQLFADSSPPLVALAETVRDNPANRLAVKVILGVGINSTDSNIVVLRRILKCLGLKLAIVRRETTGERQRIYKIVGIHSTGKLARSEDYLNSPVIDDDGRDAIFAAWLAKDEMYAARFVAGSRPLNQGSVCSSTSGIYNNSSVLVDGNLQGADAVVDGGAVDGTDSGLIVEKLVDGNINEPNPVVDGGAVDGTDSGLIVEKLVDGNINELNPVVDGGAVDGTDSGLIVEKAADALTSALDVGEDAVRKLMQCWEPTFRFDVIQALEGMAMALFDKLIQVAPKVFRWLDETDEDFLPVDGLG